MRPNVVVTTGVLTAVYFFRFFPTLGRKPTLHSRATQIQIQVKQMKRQDTFKRKLVFGIASSLLIVHLHSIHLFAQITSTQSERLRTTEALAPKFVDAGISRSPAVNTLTTPDASSSAITSLSSGVSATFTLPAVQRSTLFSGDYGYTISVPSGTARLVVTLSTATANADVDLYVRFGQDVDLSSGSVVADYRSESTTGQESITISNPASGTYYIGFGVFTLNIAITSTVTATNTASSSSPPPSGPGVLSTGVPASFSLPAVTTSTLFHGDFSYIINVPSGVSQLAVRLTVNTPNAGVDLYVRYSQDVALTGGNIVTDYRSNESSGDRTVTVNSPAAGTYYIAFGVFTLNTTISATVTASTTIVARTPLISNALILPQFVSGGGWTTTLFLTNTGSTADNYTVKFYNLNGAARTVSLVGLAATDRVTGNLTAGQTVIYETAATATLEPGWASIEPSSSGSRITGFAVFRLHIAGLPDAEAIVTLGNLSDRTFVLLYDQQNGYSTGFALVNPTTSTGTYSVSVRDQNGGLIGTDSITLPPFGQLALFVNEKYSSTNGKKGSLTITANSAVSILGLRFSPANSFTSFPPLK
jgi:hypothetical protein